MDVRLRRLPRTFEKAVQVLSISYKWRPEYLSEVTHPDVSRSCAKDIL